MDAKGKGDPGHCYKCNSSYKITALEDADGIWCCQGLCRRQHVRGSVGVAVLTSGGGGVDEKNQPRMGPAGDDCAKEEVAPVKSEEWKNGDSCRAIYATDGREYEGILTSIEETDEGNKYGTVSFVGFDASDTVWLKDLLKSGGPDAIAKQLEDFKHGGGEATNGEGHGGGEAKGGDLDSNPAAVPKEWKINDRCRVVYPNDGATYEGVVEQIENSGEGRPYAQVRFVGFGNAEYVWLEELMESLGEEAIRKQEGDAKNVIPSGAANGDVYADADSNGDKVENVVVAEPEVEVKAAPDASPSVVDETASASAAVDKKWQAGDFCRAIFSVDGVEYEGILQSVDASDGREYAVVKFLGYGDEETVWCSDLKPTHGDEVRNLQLGQVTATAAADPLNDAAAGTPVDILPQALASDDCRINNAPQPGQFDDCQGLQSDLFEENKALKGKLAAGNELQEVALANCKKYAETNSALQKEVERLKELMGVSAADNKKLCLKLAEETESKTKTLELNKQLMEENAELKKSKQSENRQLIHTSRSFGSDVHPDVNGNTASSTLAAYPMVIYAYPLGATGDGHASTQGDVLNGFANVPECQLWRIHPIPRECVLGCCTNGGSNRGSNSGSSDCNYPSTAASAEKRTPLRKPLSTNFNPQAASKQA